MKETGIKFDIEEQKHRKILILQRNLAIGRDLIRRGQDVRESVKQIKNELSDVVKDTPNGKLIEKDNVENGRIPGVNLKTQNKVSETVELAAGS